MTACELSRLRQSGVQMTVPRRRIFAGSQSFRLRRVQDSLDSPMHPRGGLGLGLPDRRQAGQHARSVDAINRQTPDRPAISLQRVFPLLTMLRIGERLFDSLNEGESIGAERGNA
jgi:hypothetical protein